MSRAPLLPLLPVALALATSCEPSTPPDQELVQASREVSFGDIANLGAHRLEASILRSVVVDGTRQEGGQDQIQLVWRDWDNFQLARRRSGEIISQVLVDGGSARVRQADGRLVAASDVEPHRVELRMAWDVWSLGLSVFDGMYELRHLGDGQLDGRAASQYGVTLLPSEQRQRGRVVADSLEGTVWIDEATAVRLMAEVQGSWHRVGQDTVVNEVKVILVRTDFGLAASPDGWGP
jgi:hypothetical protein